MQLLVVALVPPHPRRAFLHCGFDSLFFPCGFLMPYCSALRFLFTWSPSTTEVAATVRRAVVCWLCTVRQQRHGLDRARLSTRGMVLHAADSII